MRDSQMSSGRNLEWHNITTKCALEVLSMGYWPSVRSSWLDIGLLFLRVYGPRRSRGP